MKTMTISEKAFVHVCCTISYYLSYKLLSQEHEKSQHQIIEKLKQIWEQIAVLTNNASQSYCMLWIFNASLEILSTFPTARPQKNNRSMWSENHLSSSTSMINFDR